MLTVRHIHLTGGEEIMLVHSARFAPGRGMEGRPALVNGESATPDTLWVSFAAGQSEEPLTGGTVFVMNDLGKTVAHYDLGGSAVPPSVSATAWPPGMNPPS